MAQRSMSQHRGNGRTQGALLIELMMTLLMFAVGVFGLASAMLSAQRSQSWSRDRLLASRTLASQLELIGSTPFDSIQSTYNGKTLTTTTVSGYTKGTNPRAPVVRAVVTAINATLLGVTLTSTWSDERGTESLTLYQEFGK